MEMSGSTGWSELFRGLRVNSEHESRIWEDDTLLSDRDRFTNFMPDSSDKHIARN